LDRAKIDLGERLTKTDFENIQRYYEGVYGQKSGESFPFDYHRTSFFIQPFLTNLGLEKRILDVGCGVGYACMLLERHGYIPYGVDISETALDQARSNLPNGIFTSANPKGVLDFQDSYFQGLSCLGVLEHIQDPIKMVNECFRVLEVNSDAVFVVPNSRSPYFQFRKNGTGQILETPRSYSEWSTIFINAGFEIISVSKDPGPGLQKTDSWARKLRLFSNRLINRLPVGLTYQFHFHLRKVQ
jgi:2-polyprenyl-3-methyl-5-hydroxy-6-metoxy-1,4-benzoquinol methylase